MEKKQQFDGGKVVMTVIFISVTAMIFLLIGYYAGINAAQGTSSVIPLVTATATPATSATATATVDMSSWKTYANGKCGFSFKYPSDWKFETLTNLAVCSDIDIISPEVNKTSGSSGSILRVTSSDNFSGIDSTATTLSGFLKETGHTNVSNIALAGQKAYGFTETGIGDFGTGSQYRIIAENAGHIYRLEFTEASADKLTPTENQILSTFRFTK